MSGGEADRGRWAPLGDTVARDTVSGLKWTYGATAVGAVLQIGFTAAMGRLLTPADFGLVAMANAFLQFGNHFATLGMSSALVQKRELTSRDVRAGFTSSTLLGLLFAVVFWAAAPLGTTVFEGSSVVPIIRVLAVGFLLHGMQLTARSLLRRALRFRAIAVVQVASYGIGYAGVGVGLAIAGAGVWSLVGAAIGQSVISTLLYYTHARHPLAPLIGARELRALYGFGSRVSVIGILEYIGSKLDVFFIGRYVGAAPLGQYNRAALVVDVPLSHLTSGLSSVLFPTFSRIQSDRARVRRGYLSLVRLTAAVAIPVAAGMAVAAPELVRVVLGPQWGEAAQLVPLLTLAITLSLLTHFGGIVCEALAELNKKLLLQATFVALLALLLFLSVGRGLLAFAVAVAVGQAVRHGMYMILLTRVLDVRPGDYWRVYGPSLQAAAIVVVGVGLVSVGLRGTTAPAVLVFAAQIVTGAICLFTAMWWGPLAGVRRELHERLSRAGVFEGGPRRLKTMGEALLVRGR